MHTIRLDYNNSKPGAYIVKQEIPQGVKEFAKDMVDAGFSDKQIFQLAEMPCCIFCGVTKQDDQTVAMGLCDTCAKTLKYIKPQ